MRFAQIEDGVVKNVVKADPEFAEKHGLVPAENCSPGDLFDGQRFTKPEVVEQVKKASISDLDSLPQKQLEAIIEHLKSL